MKTTKTEVTELDEADIVEALRDFAQKKGLLFANTQLNISTNSEHDTKVYVTITNTNHE